MTRQQQRDPETTISRRTLVHGLAVFAGATAAAGLGLVNSLGNIGGFVSPYLVGLIKSATGNTQIALVFLAGCLAVTGLIVYRYSGTRPEGDVDVSATGTLSPANTH